MTVTCFLRRGRGILGICRGLIRISIRGKRRCCGPCMNLIRRRFLWSSSRNQKRRRMCSRSPCRRIWGQARILSFFVSWTLLNPSIVCTRCWMAVGKISSKSTILRWKACSVTPARTSLRALMRTSQRMIWIPRRKRRGIKTFLSRWSTGNLRTINRRQLGGELRWNFKRMSGTTVGVDRTIWLIIWLLRRKRRRYSLRNWSQSLGGSTRISSRLGSTCLRILCLKVTWLSTWKPLRKRPMSILI